MYFIIIYLQVLIILCISRIIHTVCWKGSYGRGVGSPLTVCGSDQDQNGALCYPQCQSGYYGIGPVCWEICRSGYDDHGITCFKNADVYAKGCCCTAYDTGCCFKCKSGYTDDGCTCRRNVEIYFKKNYGRTAGVPLSCDSSLEQSGGLCYSKCRSNYTGLGPVCWSNCRGDYTYDCGAFCSKNSNDCTETSVIVSVIPVASLVLLLPENKCPGD